MTSISKINSIQPTLLSKNVYNPHSFIEIDKKAIDHNIHYYKNHIGIHNSLALVIKGNGYGHGLIAIGLIAQQNNFVDWLCVAHYTEALELIHAGVTKPILVLGYVHPHHIIPAFDTIHFMIDSVAYAAVLNEVGKTHSQQISVHVKIDTGLSRFGIQPTQTQKFIQQLRKLSYIKIDGIFSHFIASDTEHAITKQQLELFCSAIASIAYSNAIAHIHMSNTGSITQLQYPPFCNLFRVGLGVYGYGHDHLHLQSTLIWKTSIISIKTIPAHSYVSYACTYKTSRTTRIALLPVGYDDGYQLRFSNKTHVLINNFPAPVIGRIGMNTTIIDVTDCPAFIGDEVILIGSAEKIRATNLAHVAGIYNVREILTGLHPQIKKITLNI